MMLLATSIRISLAQNFGSLLVTTVLIALGCIGFAASAAAQSDELAAAATNSVSLLPAPAPQRGD